MRFVIVALVATIGASRADAAPAEIVVPETWTKETAPESQLAPFRSIPDASRVVGTKWRFHNGTLVFIEADVEVLGRTRKFAEEFEGGIVTGLARANAATTSPPTRRTENNRLIIDHVVENQARMHMRRVYAADEDDVLHIVIATCTSLKADPECDAALDTIRLPITAVPLENDVAKALSYRIGYLFGILLVLGFVAWLVFRKKKAAKERLV